MTSLTLPRLLGHDGKPLRLDLDLDAPLVGPSTFAIVSSNGNNDGCNMWRVWQPFKMLQTHGYPADWEFRQTVAESKPAASLAARYKAHLVCRAGALPHERSRMADWFKQMRAAGKVTLYECDDDLFSPFMTDQQLRRVKGAAAPEQQLEVERESAIWAMERCDGVTVTTQHLASTVRRYTRAPVEVVPNAPDAGWFQQILAIGRRTVPPLTIGWAGGHRPDTDVTQMAMAWGRLAKRYPRLTFVVQGSQPWPIYRYVPATRIKSLPWFDILTYPHGLMNVDIGCCPLEDRPFNRCKSPIKAWEYALCGAAVVASPCVYRHCLAPGVNGELATTAEEWEHHLSRLVEDATLRWHLADQLRRDVLGKWSLKKNYWRWPAAWQRLTEQARVS